MAGLSTANAANGFMQGFSFMEGVHRRGLADARADEEYAYQRHQRGLADARANEEYAYRKQRRKVIDGRQDQQWEQNQSDRQENRIMTSADELMLSLHQDINYDWENDHRFAKFVKAGPTMEGVMSGRVPLESPEPGAIIAELVPEFIEGSQVADELTGEVRLTRGRRPGTLVAAVRHKDGSLRPVTKGRSTAENDPIHEIPVDGLMQRTMAAVKIAEMARARNPEAVRAWLFSRGKLPEPTAGKNAGEYERLLVAYQNAPEGSQRREMLKRRLDKLTDTGGSAEKTLVREISRDMDGNVGYGMIKPDEGTITPLVNRERLPAPQAAPGWDSLSPDRQQAV